MAPLLVIASLLALLGGCAGSPGPASAKPERGGPVSPRTAKPGPAQRRVIVADPRSALTMILVDARHPWRKTRKGRRRLSLNHPREGYKVLTPRAMDALLESLDHAGFKAMAEPFVAGDEAYFGGQGANHSFRGILYVETGRQRQKVLAWRPSNMGDVGGQTRYKTFIRFKGLVYYWYNSRAETESPDSGELRVR